jgi:hypothetical protein
VGKARASVVVIDPTATVSSTKALASVSIVLPIAAVSYIELVAEAYSDSTGRYQFIADTYVVADQTLVSVAKAFQDNTSASEAISAFAVDKGLTETLTLSDVCYPVLVLIRDNVDSFDVSDEDILSFGKNLVETIAATEGDRLVSYDKGLTENQAILEALSVGFSGCLDDIAPVGDIVNFVNGWARVFAETISTSDSYSHVLQWSRTIDDSAAPTELLAYGFSKPFTDEATLADSAVPSLEFLRSAEDSNISLVGTSGLLNVHMLNDLKVNGATDIETFASTVGKNVQDDFTATESYSRVLTWYRSPTDSLEVIESLLSDLGKQLSDSSTPTDLLSSETSFARSVADSAGPSDLTISTVGKAASDSVTITESLAYVKTSAAPFLLNAYTLNIVPLNANY